MLGVVVGFGEVNDVVEGVVDEESFLESVCGELGNFWALVFEQVDEGGDVVAAHHGAEEFDGFFGGEEGAGGFAFGDRSQKGGFDVAGGIDAGGDAIAQ